MKATVLAAAAAGLMIASPAGAALRIAFSVDGSTFACAVGQACDLSASPTTILLGAETLGGVTISGTFADSSTGPDELNVSNLSILNTNRTPETLRMAISDNGYIGRPSDFSAAAAGTWTGAGKSSTAAYGFWVDNANVTGAATASDTPGADIINFSDKSTSDLPNAFADNKTAAFAAFAPFSMTEGAVFDLAGGARLVGNEQAIVGVPEARTWVLMGAGFTLIGVMGLGRGRRGRYAI